MLLPAILAVAFSQPLMETPTPDRVLANFFDPGEPSRWITVNDNVMGGRSTGGPVFADGILTFSGSTNTNGGGFSSIRTREQSWDIGDADGLLVRVRGDGRSYIAAMTTDQRAMWGVVSYWQEFDTTDGEWATLRLPFHEFTPTTRGVDLTGRVAPLDPAKAETIGFYIYDKKDGPFRLDVAWIGTYTESEPPSDPPRAETAGGSQRVLAALELAISRGVPRFNRGDHGACADIYETSLTTLLAVSDDLPAEARTEAEEGLRAGRSARSQADRAWAYRGAIDTVARLVAEASTREPGPTGQAR